ncbi:MAG: TM2 domain-containing protein [Patescibacteria group bacterium]|jgi:TM2 domain-containing membrane protein YozV
MSKETKLQKQPNINTETEEQVEVIINSEEQGTQGKKKKEKDRTVAALLAFFLGGLGVHRFYLGKTVSGVIMLIFSWTMIPAFVALIDFIIIITTDKEDFNKKYNS